MSQLLHHALHHLRFVLQQLRRELLIQPSLSVKRTKEQSHNHTIAQSHCRTGSTLCCQTERPCYCPLTSSSLAISSAGVITSSWLSSWLTSHSSSNVASDILHKYPETHLRRDELDRRVFASGTCLFPPRQLFSRELCFIFPSTWAARQALCNCVRYLVPTIHMCAISTDLLVKLSRVFF